MIGNENKPRIVIVGRRNVGKSTLVNCLTGQHTAIVSSTPGTTTDPVRKSMEIIGIGPVVLIDTAGLDDVGALGSQRVERSMAMLSEADMVVLLFEQWGEPECLVEHHCAEQHTPLLRVAAKADGSLTDAAHADVRFSSLIEHTHAEVLSKIASLMPPSAYTLQGPLSGLVHRADKVVLVAPIDSAAPQGRLILPQVQVLRSALDEQAIALVCQPQQLRATLDAMGGEPQLVVTDSQAFAEVANVLPATVPLTSFSVLLARQKGPFEAYLKGTPTIGRLRQGDKVLLLESCTHTTTCDDIGRRKLPAALRKAASCEINCTVLGGAAELPADLDTYALVIQCGGCTLSRKQLQARLQPALDADLPVSNYGLALAWCAGIFNRATQIFHQ